MVGLLIAMGILVGAVLAFALYLYLLPSLMPEKIRTNEVLHVRTRDLWLLRVCRYRKSDAAGEPVLLVHGMGANQNNFTCPENGCLVDYLSAKGYDCWTVDLRGARSSQPPFERTRNDVRMEDFFIYDLPAVIQHILQATHYTKLHWVGHSMGGMLLYAYAQIHGSGQIASGTALGSPIDFSDAAGKVPLWLVSLGARCPHLAGRFIRGLVPVLKALGISQSAFPVNIRNLPENMRSEHFVNMLEDPLPSLMMQVKHWLEHKEYTLLDGQLDVAAGLPEFPVPLLAFYAAEDPFIDPKRAMACFSSIKIEDKRALVCSKEEGFAEDYSHCDLAFGREAETEIFAPVHQWLQAHPCRQAETEALPEAAADDSVLTGALEPAAKTARKAVPKKKSAAAKKKPASTKKPAVKKKVAVKKASVTKPAASKKATAVKPVKKAEAPSSDAVENLDISPEAQARAEAIRAARNQAFSEIGARLNEISTEKTE